MTTIVSPDELIIAACPGMLLETDLTDFRYILGYSPRQLSHAFIEFMTPEDYAESEATYRAFLANKPNPPEHVDYMARAAELYPALPPGAQQNALHCDRTLGKGYAKRYVANASARQSQLERALMGTTLSAWRVKRSDEAKPYSFEGVCTWSPKRRREHADFVNRYNDYMAEGRAKAALAQTRARKKAERRLATEIAAVAMPVAAPKIIIAPRAKIVDSKLVDDLIALLKSEKGATYAEAAEALEIKSKGDRPHQSPAAQVRALVRDKVRPVHEIIASEHDSARGGAVYRLQTAA